MQSGGGEQVLAAWTGGDAVARDVNDNGPMIVRRRVLALEHYNAPMPQRAGSVVDKWACLWLHAEDRRFTFLERTRMDIHSADKLPTRRGPADYFTGTVWQDPVVEAPSPARLRVNRVSFEPGARTAWHTHPLGQTLYVLSGTGRTQTWGGPVRTLRSGDTVWIPPGEKHWHGAAPTNGLVHLAMQEALDGVSVVWLEHVADDAYKAAPVS